MLINMAGDDATRSVLSVSLVIQLMVSYRIVVMMMVDSDPRLGHFTRQLRMVFCYGRPHRVYAGGRVEPPGRVHALFPIVTPDKTALGRARILYLE